MGIEVPNLYPKSAALREQVQGIKVHVEKNIAFFEKDRSRQMRAMFGPDFNFSLATRAEYVDVDAWVRFATKRVAKGAVSSRAFHDYYERNPPSEPEPVVPEIAALNDWGKEFSVGHDAMHVALAYGRSGEASPRPAYEYLKTLEDEQSDEYKRARLEEGEVELLSRTTSVMREIFKDLQRGKSLLASLTISSKVDASLREWKVPFAERKEIAALKDANPALWGVRVWEAYIAYKEEDGGFRKFAAENRNPIVLNIMEDLYKDSLAKQPDPNFGLHQLQRITAPVLTRLRAETPV